MSELNRSALGSTYSTRAVLIPQFDQGGVHKGVSVTLNIIMMLTPDLPSPSLNDNLSIMLDHLIYS